MLDLIYFSLIGIVSGCAGNQIMRGRSFGPVGNLIFGVEGAVTGGLVFRLVGPTTIGFFGSLLCAVVGAILFLFLSHKISRRFYSR